MRALLLLFLFLMLPASGWGTDVVEEEREGEKFLVIPNPKRSDPPRFFKATELIEDSDFVIKDAKLVYALREIGSWKNAIIDRSCLFFPVPTVLIKMLVNDYLITLSDKLAFITACRTFMGACYPLNEKAIQRRWNVSIPQLLKVSCDFIFTNASNYKVSITACDEDYDEDSFESPSDKSIEISPWKTAFLDFSVLRYGNEAEKWVFVEVFPRKKGDLSFYSSAKMKLK